jgi:hypothetical protein
MIQHLVENCLDGGTFLPTHLNQKHASNGQAGRRQGWHIFRKVTAMSTISIVGVLDPDVLDAKDRHARQLIEKISETAAEAGDKESSAEIISGQIFFGSKSLQAMQSVKGLFTVLDGVTVKDLSDLGALSVKSRLSHDVKRAQEAKEAARVQR